MKKDLSFKKVAMQKLLALAEDRSFDIYETTGDSIYGYRAWPLNWSEHLYGIKKCSDKEVQDRLNKTLLKLACGDLPDTIKQLAFERKAIQLVLDAGADPNVTYGHEGPVFQIFVDNQKRYGALAVAKHPDFNRPEDTEKTFRILSHQLAFYRHWGRACPSEKDEEMRLNKQTTADDKELLFVLFQKEIYPYREDTFDVLYPIIVKDNPLFFKQVKETKIVKLSTANTDKRIWKELIGQQKEKE